MGDELDVLRLQIVAALAEVKTRLEEMNALIRQIGVRLRDAQAVHGTCDRCARAFRLKSEPYESDGENVCWACWNTAKARKAKR